MSNGSESSKDWDYAKTGIALWLNNDPEGAEEHFKGRTENTRVFAGYAFIKVLNAIISYEIDKIELAQGILRELERRCSSSMGFINSFRNRVFGTELTTKPLSVELEEKIILADSLMCSAILTFLTQDYGGLIKGSWLLRRAWKIYQTTYEQIYSLHKVSKTSKENIQGQPSTPADMEKNILTRSPDDEGLMNLIRCADTSIVRSKTTSFTQSRTQNGIRPNRLSAIVPQYHKSLSQLANSPSSGYSFMPRLPKSFSSKFSLDRLSPVVPQSSDDKSPETNNPPSRTISSNSQTPSKSSLTLDLPTEAFLKNASVAQVPLSCPNSGAYLSTQETSIANSDLNYQVLSQLMGAVSFGYGIFQLSISLLPPSLMKLISFFGFEGNKKLGLACLSYAKTSDDVRAPFATLALLWYYTIGAQLFHVEEDDAKNELVLAKQILNESKSNCATSAIFLFFRGRLKRLQCKINDAIGFYDAAYRMSAQKELKLLCLHEVGWCRLVQLDFGNAMLHFHELKLASNFSKSFYTYMSTICQGAFGRFHNLVRLRLDMEEIVNRSGHKENQIDKFIIRRIGKFPSSVEEVQQLCAEYFKLFVYEMLFLWNTLNSCSQDVLELIMKDCSEANERSAEPSVGLAHLILGSCHAQLKQFPEAILSFRRCIEKRDGIAEDAHLSAFAHYELAIMLTKQKGETSLQEAKAVLTHAQKCFKNYDFETRLNARIYAMLNSLQSEK